MTTSKIYLKVILAILVVFLFVSCADTSSRDMLITTETEVASIGARTSIDARNSIIAAEKRAASIGAKIIDNSDHYWVKKASYTPTPIPTKPGSTKTVSQEELSGPPTSFFIGSFEAISYIGTSQTVCGDVVDTNYASTSSGSPTFLNFDQPYPNNSFVVVIWGKSRQQFPFNPEIHYLNKQVCTTGKIEIYRGTPEMTVTNASQLTILRPTRGINMDPIILSA